MAFRFSKTSRKRLDTVHPALVSIVESALDVGLVAFSVTCGARTEAEQNRLFAQGKSRLPWPAGKHCAGPGAPRELSAAVDLVPITFGQPDWDARVCAFLAGIVMTCAVRAGVKVRWGGNWDQDGDVVRDQSFNDLVHFELVHE